MKSGGVVAERTRRRIEATGFADFGIPPVTASFGVTQYQGPEDIDMTLARADTALYQAKSSGRNRVAFVEPTHDPQIPAIQGV